MAVVSRAPLGLHRRCVGPQRAGPCPRGDRTTALWQQADSSAPWRHRAPCLFPLTACPGSRHPALPGGAGGGRCRLGRGGARWGSGSPLRPRPLPLT